MTPNQWGWLLVSLMFLAPLIALTYRKISLRAQAHKTKKAYHHVNR